MLKIAMAFAAAALACGLAATATARNVQGERAPAGNALGPLETITGAVVSAIPEQGLIIRSPDQATYSFKITPATKIRIGDAAGSLEDLAARKDRKATITFIPTRAGNIAKTVTVE